MYPTLPRFFVNWTTSTKKIKYYDIKSDKIKQKIFTRKDKIKNIIITSGASCPDSLMESLIRKIKIGSSLHFKEI